MNGLNGNVAINVEKVVDALQAARKLIFSAVLVMIIAIFIHGSYEHFKNIEEDIEFLQSMVSKLNHKSENSNEIASGADKYHSLIIDSKLRWENLKDEMHEEMSKVPNIVKNQRFDFAFEGAGGRVVSYHDTQLMYECSSFTILRGMCREVNPPSKAIQSSVEPGEAFCFRGSRGSITIRLACDVAVDSITIDHVDVSMTPNGNYSDAPKEFTLWGMKNFDDESGYDYGKFKFDPLTFPSQTFHFIEPTAEKYRFVRLNIVDNYGNSEKTCLYRIRVHGFVDEC